VTDLDARARMPAAIERAYRAELKTARRDPDVDLYEIDFDMARLQSR
jgi:hypothetical protein